MENSFEDWWYQQHTYQVMFTNPGESSNSSQQDGLGHLAFTPVVPTEVECIDPAFLHLGGEFSNFSPFIQGSQQLVVDCSRGAVREYLVSINESVVSTPNVPESIMDVDEGSSGTAGFLVAEETNEQFFDRPEVRELVHIPDTPDIPEASPLVETEAEEPEEWNPSGSPRPISPALSSPPSPPPPSPSPLPLYLEPSGVPVYPVERIVQAWGPHDGRQYLIRWQGWGEEYDSWEVAANVSEDLVANFERSRLRRRLSQSRQRRQRRKWG